MLKNIVFDLGNVLVKFDSNELIYSFFNERQEEVKSFYFVLYGMSMINDFIQWKRC